MRALIIIGLDPLVNLVRACKAANTYINVQPRIIKINGLPSKYVNYALSL